MKVLYAIQSSGYISQVMEIIPALQQFAEVDLLLSGSQYNRTLPWDVKFRIKGLDFKTGIPKINNKIKLSYISDTISSLANDINTLPVDDYDIVFSDFEPVSAWACKRHNKSCIGLSHHHALLNQKMPKPEGNEATQYLFKHYAPVSQYYGFNFTATGNNITTPVIRREIREAVPIRKGYYAVYLPSINDLRVIEMLARSKKVHWKVFSKNLKHPYSYQNINVHPFSDEVFTKSLIESKGIICDADFTISSEVLFLGKKLCVVPADELYEQQCNAAILGSMGVTVINRFNENSSYILDNWLCDEKTVSVYYPDVTANFIEKIFDEVSDSLGNKMFVPAG